MAFWEYLVPGYGLYAAGRDIKNGLSDPNGWMNQRPTAPHMGSNPYQGQYNDLIDQLRQQASGEGPSLAGNAYKQAQQTGMNNVLAMSRSGSAGGTRQAGRTLGQMNQGFNQGYSNARLQEQLLARQQLQGALGGASQAWFQPQYANLNAQLQSPTNLQMLTGFLQQLMTGAGTLAGAA